MLGSYTYLAQLIGRRTCDVSIESVRPRPHAVAGGDTWYSFLSWVGVTRFVLCIRC